MSNGVEIDYSVLYKNAPCTTPQDSQNDTKEYKETLKSGNANKSVLSGFRAASNFYTRYSNANKQSEDLRIEINKALASGKPDIADLLYKCIKALSLITGDTALLANADRWKEKQHFL